MKLSHSWKSVCFLLTALALFAGRSIGQERLFRKYGGRVPIFSLRFDYPSPALLLPDEDCTNGADDDGDAKTDYADLDCQGGLGPQDLFLKLPFDVIQPVGTFAPARFTGTNRNGDPLGELLINSTGPGGRKVSYLRTGDPNTYEDVTVRAALLPGKTGDQGGPVAIRIQPANAPTHAGMSYFVKTVPGNRISIQKEMGDGTTVELAGASAWASGDPINIQDYDDIIPTNSPCYQVSFSAVGGNLTATVSEVDCLGPVLNRLGVLNDHTVTLTATDSDLAEGYLGLRSDNDRGGDLVDDQESALHGDPSVIDYFIGDPEEKRLPGAPRIAFFNSYSSNLDDLDYTTAPITSFSPRPHHRSGSVLADISLASYLRSLGFQVDEYHIASFVVGLPEPVVTPEFINENYDLFWLPSSGGSDNTRTYVRRITIPFIFAEHVDGSTSFAGLWQGTGNLNGNENQAACPQTRFFAMLNGAQEKPDPIITNATGSAFFDYNPDTHELSFEIQYSGLSSPETGAHLHLAPAAESGPVIHPLPAGNPKTGTFTLSEDEQAALLAGNIYVNVHSQQNPDGEIRGQLQARTLSFTTLRLLSKEQGGDPDHPIVRGLADDRGDVPVHDARQIPLNVGYPFPGAGPAGLTGAGFKSVAETLEARGWGFGAPETQFAGWPAAPGALSLAAMVNPCTGDPFWNVDEGGNLVTPDGKGHIHLVAADAGTERMVVDPENCNDPCVFESRTIFYWMSDPIFPYSTPQALSILRRSALWALRLLDSPNRSDIPFKRGDANADGTIDISDSIFVLSWLFTGGDEPTCRDTADANDDERADISDPVYSLSFQFLGGPEPPFPFAINFQGCGLDFTPPAPKAGEVEEPESILSCNSYKACRS